MEIDRKALVKALRCSAAVHNEEKCKECGYCIAEEIPEDMRDYLKPTYEEGGVPYFISCDCDRMALEAADLIEELSE